MKLFGQKGYDNTSVRDLIDEAGVNLSAINYHFGGKEGLRFAVIDFLASGFHADGPGQFIAQLTDDKIASMGEEEARVALRRIMKATFVRSATSENADHKTRYIQRELIQGGKPTELFFEKVFSIQLKVMCRLVAKITGDDVESKRVKLSAINLIAQSVFLNLARPLVLMALDWDEYDVDDADMIAESFWLHRE